LILDKQYMTSAAELPAGAGSTSSAKLSQTTDPLRTATGVYVTVHGHFYQPPRENPYLDAIERQPGAAPFHAIAQMLLLGC
jgi:hypothetical protein